MFNEKFLMSNTGGGFYPKELEQSLRFNDDDSAYLSWTPASAGDRKTWTWSGWVKRGNLGIFGNLFSSDTNNIASQHRLRFISGDKLDFFIYDGLNDYQIETNSLFRDVSAWYHVVAVFDTSNATSTDRMRLYVNGDRITSFSTTNYPALNYEGILNNSVSHSIGRWVTSGYPSEYLDGYLSEVHFVDGQALDATSFGEFKNGVWVPKDVSVTYGTNGFYLPFRNDYTVEGFSTVTYRGNGSTQYIGGVGFEPDLVWIKVRNNVDSHALMDSVRGEDAGGYLILSSDQTYAESVYDTSWRSIYGSLQALSTDGFTVEAGSDATNTIFNNSSDQYVAWCWDAGTGSPASNTDGSITSTVKANPAYGFSVVSYTGTGSNATVGHGLSSAPDMVIVKDRTGTEPWRVWSTGYSSIGFTTLNDTTAFVSNSTVYTSAPTDSLVNIGTSVSSNGSSKDYIAYCFHSVSGYSDFGSYTGTGASGNTVTTGFKPAFVMIKRTDSADSWYLHDNVRDPVNPSDTYLNPDLSNAEYSAGAGFFLDFTDTGFELISSSPAYNASGGTYIYMAFADTREAAFWLDDSGNNNDWENNNLTESDIVLDSPTNNFATLNPITNAFWYQSGGIAPLQEGNLLVGATASPEQRDAVGTIGVSSGKWYWELVVLTKSGSSAWSYGVVNADTGTKYLYYAYNGDKWITSLASYAATWDVNDVMGIVFDADAGTVTFYKNNVSQGVAFTGLSGTFLPLSMALGGSDYTVAHNFGQDSSFAGNKTPQGNTDANGIGDFYYAPPAGYLALCTSNLPEPAIGPNSDTTSDEHFNTVLYTGDGATRSITGVGFQPDWLWIKGRDYTFSHMTFDAVRGAGNLLRTDATASEASYGQTSFDADGWSMSGVMDAINGSGHAYVAWNWKANGSGVSNSDGSITSTVSANTDAGFSIVSYTGTGSTATVGHGLDNAPDVVILKDRSRTDRQWPVYHSSIGPVNLGFLNLTNAYASSPSSWNSTSPTPSVISLGTDLTTNQSGDAFIAYCFHSVDGFSKFGSYTGNGSADGSFIYCGFRPSFVMIKRTDSAGSWEIYDNNRIGYNVDNNTLFADLSNAESTADRIDILSNGFKLRSTAGDNNASGGTYIYMAFAENPFKYSNAR